jgi:hypothetical protein
MTPETKGQANDKRKVSAEEMLELLIQLTVSCNRLLTLDQEVKMNAIGSLILRQPEVEALVEAVKEADEIGLTTHTMQNALSAYLAKIGERGTK